MGSSCHLLLESVLSLPRETKLVSPFWPSCSLEGEQEKKNPKLVWERNSHFWQLRFARKIVMPCESFSSRWKFLPTARPSHRIGTASTQRMNSRGLWLTTIDLSVDSFSSFPSISHFQHTYSWYYFSRDRTKVPWRAPKRSKFRILSLLLRDTRNWNHESPNRNPSKHIDSQLEIRLIWPSDSQRVIASVWFQVQRTDKTVVCDIWESFGFVLDSFDLITSIEFFGSRLNPIVGLSRWDDGITTSAHKIAQDEDWNEKAFPNKKWKFQPFM